MRRTVLCFAVLTSLNAIGASTYAAAEDTKTSEDPCSAAAQDILDATTSTFVSTLSWQTYLLFHPFVGNYSLKCEGNEAFTLEFRSESPVQDFQWYAVVTLAAESIGLDSMPVEERSKSCLRKASFEDPEEQFMEGNGFTISCAKSREGNGVRSYLWITTTD